MYNPVIHHHHVIVLVVSINTVVNIVCLGVRVCVCVFVCAYVRHIALYDMVHTSVAHTPTYNHGCVICTICTNTPLYIYTYTHPYVHKHTTPTFIPVVG